MDDILSFISHNPSGVTITDIAKGIDSSRVTAGKYIAVLLERQEVFFKEIGAYKLYFSSKSQLIPRELVYAYFSGILKGLDSVIKDKKKLKLIGKSIAENTDFPYGSKFPEEVLPSNNGQSVSNFFKYFGNMIPFVPFVFRNKINVNSQINETERKAVYSIGNLQELSGFMQNHFYIMTGVIEHSIIKKLNIDAKCQIEKIDVENKIVEFSIKFL